MNKTTLLHPYFMIECNWPDVLAVDVAVVWTMTPRKWKDEIFNGGTNQWKYFKSVIKFKRKAPTGLYEYIIIYKVVSGGT